MIEKFERSAISERLVRAHRVVDVFPAAKLRVQRFDVPTIGDHRIELLMVRAMRTLSSRPKRESSCPWGISAVLSWRGRFAVQTSLVSVACNIHGVIVNDVSLPST